jgi:3-hydroxy-5-methyl-1-naphthoate 3-O-methyltransferase
VLYNICPLALQQQAFQGSIFKAHMNPKQQALPCPPSELLDLATGYQRSQTFFTLIELGVPTLLNNCALTSVEIAKKLGIHPLAADRFLNACAGLGLLERKADKFTNSALSQQFLIKDQPTYLGEQFLRYERTSYPLWSELAQKLRTWQPGATEGELPEDDDQGQDSMRAQHNFALLTGASLGATYDFAKHRSLLDLGGSTGAMSLGICQQHTELHAIVYDLPEIVELARQFIRQAALTDRIEVQAGNFKEDELPKDFDVALLANLLSVASEETNRTLLRRLYEQLPEDGAVILSGWILENNRTSPLIAALFCLEDINREAPDVERTVATYEEWLTTAGFVVTERAMYCPPTMMIVGCKRAAR